MTPVTVQRMLHEKHALHGLAELAGVDKQQAQTTWKMFMAVQAGKTPTTKKIYFSQEPVSSSFCEHFLSPVQTGLTELKGTSSLPSVSGFIYLSCLLLSIFLRNYTDILAPVLLNNG